MCINVTKKTENSLRAILGRCSSVVAAKGLPLPGVTRKSPFSNRLQARRKTTRLAQKRITTASLALRWTFAVSAGETAGLWCSVAPSRSLRSWTFCASETGRGSRRRNAGDGAGARDTSQGHGGGRQFGGWRERWVFVATPCGSTWGSRSRRGESASRVGGQCGRTCWSGSSGCWMSGRGEPLASSRSARRGCIGSSARIGFKVGNTTMRRVLAKRRRLEAEVYVDNQTVVLAAYRN